MIPQLPILARVPIYLRFARYLLWEFRWPVTVFVSLVLAGGTLLWLFYGPHTLSFAHACHVVFLMIFLESSLDFPEEGYLQPLFFILPVVGLGAVADSLVRLAFLMFSRKQNQPEWNRMLASLCRNHVVVVGVGRVGYQIVKELIELRETVVTIDKNTEADLLPELGKLGIPVIQGNARQKSILEQAGISHAKALIASTSDDLSNLDVGLTAREINQQLRIVLRLFDETLAVKVAGVFGMPVISTPQVAATAFAAAATGRKIYQAFQLAEKSVHLVDLTLRPNSRLIGKTVGDIQADKRINIVMHQGAKGVNVNPGPALDLQAGDVILVIAPMSDLLELEALNHSVDSKPAGNGPPAASRPAETAR